MRRQPDSAFGIQDDKLAVRERNAIRDDVTRHKCVDEDWDSTKEVACPIAKDPLIERIV